MISSVIYTPSESSSSCVMYCSGTRMAVSPSLLTREVSWLLEKDSFLPYSMLCLHVAQKEHLRHRAHTPQPLSLPTSEMLYVVPDSDSFCSPSYHPQHGQPCFGGFIYNLVLLWIAKETPKHAETPTMSVNCCQIFRCRATKFSIRKDGSDAIPGESVEILEVQKGCTLLQNWQRDLRGDNV